MGIKVDGMYEMPQEWTIKCFKCGREGQLYSDPGEGPFECSTCAGDGYDYQFRKVDMADMTGGPIEPSATVRQAAKEVRGMFLALIAEGFTEKQALILIGQILEAGSK